MIGRGRGTRKTGRASGEFVKIVKAVFFNIADGEMGKIDLIATPVGWATCRWVSIDLWGESAAKDGKLVAKWTAVGRF